MSDIVERDRIVNRMHIPFKLDGGVGHRATIGLVVLATDQTIEHEWRKLLAIDGVALYESRLMNSSTITPETLKAMEGEIAGATNLILPGCKLDVVGYACTSGTMVIGEERVFELIRQARPGVPCTTPITGALAGLKALGARRIALLTPYVDAINQMMRRYIEARGITVTAMGSFNHEDDREVARIDHASIRAAALDLARHDAVDAVFVSCTSLRLAEQVEALERETGKPVTSSNHAMAWHALRLAGIADKLPGWGRLFRI